MKAHRTKPGTKNKIKINYISGARTCKQGQVLSELKLVIKLVQKKERRLVSSDFDVSITGKTFHRRTIRLKRKYETY